MKPRINSPRRRSKSKVMSQEQYRQTLDTMLEGCQIIDRDWRYVYINEAAARHGRQTP